MRSRIAVLALAAAFLAAPIPAALETGSCGPCCPMAGDAPCDSASPHCASFSAVPCCADAPAAAPSGAQGSSEARVVSVLAAPILAPSSELRERALHVDGDLLRLTSPLRLSVVLRI